jgi:GMP synthase-like glutamine amidotransferase
VTSPILLAAPSLISEKFWVFALGISLLLIFLGDYVAPAPVGWAVGVQTSDLIKTHPWMEVSGKPPEQLRLVSSHKDQVERLPQGAEVFARSDFLSNIWVYPR